MEQSQQKSDNMVIVLVVSALLLAFATYIAINMITNRPSPETATVTPAAAFQSSSLVINGVTIFLNTDPSKQIILSSEINQPEIPPNDQVGGLPTDTPAPEAPPPAPAPLPTATRDPISVLFKPYTVVQGDSLYSIAEAQNSSIELMAQNGIDAANLVPGTIIERLPYANPAYCPGMRAYVVRDKDTVFRIAAQFNTTPQAIAASNSLNESYQILVTQVICIPV